jgi:hypothetical protein
MKHVLLSCTVAALAMLMPVSSVSNAAMLPAGKTSLATKNENLVEVRRGRGFGRRGFGRRSFGRRHFGRRHFGRHRGFRRGWYRRYGYRGYYGRGIYFGGYGYGRRCGWLRRRAVITGSSYWWRRYRACRYYY